MALIFSPFLLAPEPLLQYPCARAQLRRLRQEQLSGGLQNGLQGAILTRFCSSVRSPPLSTIPQGHKHRVTTLRKSWVLLFGTFPPLSTIPQGHKHRVTTLRKSCRTPQSTSEPSKRPPQRPLRTPLRGQLPWRASQRVVPLGW